MTVIEADSDWHELEYVQHSIRLGRYNDAIPRIVGLLEPDRSTEIRLQAHRAQAALATTFGDFEVAHQLLNSATRLADRLPSRFRAALVEADRASVLALQNRRFEAVTVADRVLPSLIRPVVGPHQKWANAQAAAVAFTISRVCSNHDDQLNAQRMLIQGTAACHQADDLFLNGHELLARGAFWRSERDFEQAEAALESALRIFNHLGCSPSSALVTLEQGRLALWQGRYSAGPLLEHALATFESLGHRQEVSETRLLLEQANPHT